MALDGRARADRPAAGAAAVSYAARCRQLDDRVDRARQPRAVRRASRRGRSCASGSASVSRELSPTRCDDALPVELDGLGEWEVGQRLLDGRARRRRARATASQAELARGVAAARDARRRRCSTASGAVVAADRRRGSGAGATARRDSLDVNVLLADGRRWRGRCPASVRTTLRKVSYSRVKPTGPVGRMGAVARADRRAARARRSRRR